MAGFSDYLELKVLDWLFGGVAFTPPATYYVALYTAAPNDAGGGTEVSTGVWTNYQRAPVTKNATNFPAAASGAISNAVAITGFFSSGTTAAVTGTAPVVTHVAIMDAASAGNQIANAALTASKTINNADPVSVEIGDLDITLD